MSNSSLEKYQYKPFYGSSHRWAIDYCSREPKSGRILDIGCGSGMIGKQLRELGFTEMFGVELDPLALCEAQKTYREVVPSLTQIDEIPNDIVLLLDILEHIQDAQGVLEQSIKKVKIGGKILVSLPNVAHWSVRFALLFGQFRYTDRGILDRTHVRFYTRASALHFFKQTSGIEISQYQVSISPVEFLIPPNILRSQIFQKLFEKFSQLRWRIANLLPGLCGYQHLIVLTRKS